MDDAEMTSSTVRQRTEGSTPASDWATNLAIDIVAISHGVTHKTAIHSIADILRATRIAGQRDGLTAALDIARRDTCPTANSKP
jgi:hypothetical protein